MTLIVDEATIHAHTMLFLDGVGSRCMLLLLLLLLRVVQTVVPSAISSGDTTEFQTFDVAVHANAIILEPKFTRMDESISIKEVLLFRAAAVAQYTRHPCTPASCWRIAIG